MADGATRRCSLALSSLGDLDGDGNDDLAVGAIGDNDGGTDRGAVWVLFLDSVPKCPADFDGDGTVGAPDLAELVGSWGSYEPCPAHNAADFDEDCAVSAVDLAQLLGSWGECE